MLQWILNSSEGKVVELALLRFELLLRIVRGSQKRIIPRAESAINVDASHPVNLSTKFAVRCVQRSVLRSTSD